MSVHPWDAEPVTDLREITARLSAMHHDLQSRADQMGLLLVSTEVQVVDGPTADNTVQVVLVGTLRRPS